jgi:hypothetical protein
MTAVGIRRRLACLPNHRMHCHHRTALPACPSLIKRCSRVVHSCADMLVCHQVTPALLFKYGWDWWEQRQRAAKQQLVYAKVISNPNTVTILARGHVNSKASVGSLL